MLLVRLAMSQDHIIVFFNQKLNKPKKNYRWERKYSRFKL